jgi:hypothetical protein
MFVHGFGCALADTCRDEIILAWPRRLSEGDVTHLDVGLKRDNECSVPQVPGGHDPPRLTRPVENGKSGSGIYFG